MFFHAVGAGSGQRQPVHLPSRLHGLVAQRLYRHLLVASAVSPLGVSMTETGRILVTGGGGFIGNSLVKELVSRGNEVVASDLENRAQERYVRCDVRSFRQLERLIEKIEKPLTRLSERKAESCESARWAGKPSLWRFSYCAPPESTQFSIDPRTDWISL